MKLNKITIENFRGIRSPVTIDFIKGDRPTSALIYGRNGTGKSSIVDAWQWLNTAQIEYLNKEGVSERDYPHKSSNGANAYISVDFNNHSIATVKALFNNAKISSPIYTGPYEDFKAHSIYPNYLRYSDLQEFVYLTKGDKYKYIAKFFGLEKFVKNQSDIQTSVTKISTLLQNYQRLLLENEQVIQDITGSNIISEKTIVSFINSIADKYKIEKASNFKTAQNVNEGISKIVQTNPIASELNEWKSFQTRLNQFFPIAPLTRLCLDVEAIFLDLKNDEANITNLILIDLYTTTIETLSKIRDKTKCPICDTVFNGNLEEHVSEKHKTLEALNKKKTDYILKKDALIKNLESVIQKAFIILAENGEKVRSNPSLSSFFTDLKHLTTELLTSLNVLKKLLKELTTLSLSTNPGILKIDTIIKAENDIRIIVSDKISALSSDENSKNLANDFGNVIKISTAYTNFLKNKRKVDYLKHISTNLTVLFSKLTSYIQSRIQNTFTAIQVDLNECYNFLESTNQFLKNPEIKLVAGHDKAIELEIEFVNEKISPAFKFMSESQVNSFGLSIFLCAVKHFNRDFKFMILDDVVNSFDSFKRPKVSQLIASKFSDFQILMLTHDQIFFDTMQKAFPEWNRYKFTNWDYTNGPSCNFSKSYQEEIQELLDHDDPIGAGHKLGRYLEMVFGIINEGLQTPIRYKIENTYTLAEFYDPLVRRVKDKLKKPNKQHKISILFSEFEQGTIFRNYCAHWKNESSQFTKDEINAIFKKWQEIDTAMYCSTCKTYARFENRDGNDYVRCICGALNLMDTSNFVDVIKS